MTAVDQVSGPDSGAAPAPPRMAAVWCPDWPVLAARQDTDVPADAPIAVLTANRVVACSHTARRYGVGRGLRRRDAQSRCPELVILQRNSSAEVRAFEPVLAAIESIAPGVEVSRPGLAAIGIKGPTRYFGTETAVLHALSRSIGDLSENGALSRTGLSSRAESPDVLIGVADGAFAAEQAARLGGIVTPGGSAAFLADLPVETLDEPELADLLKRLGIRTLGAFAALPAADVHARFGPAGAWAHRQAGGVDSRPIAARRPPSEFEIRLSLEPPLDRVDSIAFSARATVERFVSTLADHGLACVCFELVARTDRGEETVRRWRHSGVLTAVDVTDRIRWQLEGWLTRRAGETNAPTGPITTLELIPIETVATGVHQKSLWGADGADDERAYRALARVQTVLGHGSVRTPVVSGGRSPSRRTQLVPWGDDRVAARQPDAPWPGRLPSPAPSVLVDPPRPVEVLDHEGRPVLVTERGAVPLPPARMRLDGSAQAVTAWAGPWPVTERWWDADTHQQVARLQIVDAGGRAYLVCYSLSERVWLLEGIYD